MSFRAKTAMILGVLLLILGLTYLATVFMSPSSTRIVMIAAVLLVYYLTCLEFVFVIVADEKGQPAKYLQQQKTAAMRAAVIMLWGTMIPFISFYHLFIERKNPTTQ